MTGLTNQQKITKILPGLTANYEVVSMPAWAWESLDNYMYLYDRPDMPSLLADFEDCLPPCVPLSELLENIAAVHQHFMKQIWHELENDNDPFALTNMAPSPTKGPKHYPQGRTYPKVVKLFGFMPHATSFETLIQRRNHIHS